MTAKSDKDSALGDPSLAGIDRSVAHRREGSAVAGSRAPAVDRDPNRLGLLVRELVLRLTALDRLGEDAGLAAAVQAAQHDAIATVVEEIGRASCRERVLRLV